MAQFTLSLQSFAQVRAFVTLVTTMPFSVLVSDGHQQVNGTSFIAMVCLDFTRPLTVNCTGSEENCLLLQQRLAEVL